MPAGMFEPSIPARLETVIGRALERSPEQRWPSMAELDAALGQLDAEALKPITAPTAPAKPPKNPSPAPPSRARRRGVWGTVGPVVPLVGAAVAFILGLRLLAPLLSGAALIGGPAKIVVPDFAGMSITEARAAAEARGLELTVLGDRLSDRVPKDTIVEQAPVAGWKVDPRQPVRVTVSSGVAVPDVRGMSLENARAALDRLGWKIGRVERGAYPGNPSGIVALQSPAPGDVATGPGELLLAVAE